MKIAIVNCTPRFSGGYKKYLCNLIPRIIMHPEIDDILLVSPCGWDIQNWFVPAPKISFSSFVFNSTYLFFPQFNRKLHDVLSRYRPDVVYVPVERSLGLKGTPVVSLLQNMEPFVRNIENNFFELLRQSIQYWAAKKAILSSTRIIALSGFVQNFLIEQWQVPKEKTTLIYYGTDDLVNEDIIRPRAIPSEWNEFLFTAGSIRPARGLEDIFRAMADLLVKGISLNLVIAGSTSPGMERYEQSLEALIQTYNLSENVCWGGSLSEKEMRWCYEKCRLFIMSSRVESFGMVAAEALAHGCFSISADSPCLPEIFGDAALYYRSRQGGELADKIQKGLSVSGEVRNSFERGAVIQANKYSWDICAERTVKVFFDAERKG